MSDTPVEITQANKITKLLNDAQMLANKGKLDHAYHLSLQATQLFPREIGAWHLRARTAPSLEEKLVCLSRLYSLDPNFPHARENMHQALQTLLKQEPSLAYLDENEELYRVKSGLELFIIVPKYRSHHQTHPCKAETPTKPAFQWLNLALIGFFLAGLGAFLLAPIAAYKALKLQWQPLNRKDRIRSLIVLVLSTFLWAAALPLTALFLLHFLP